MQICSKNTIIKIGAALFAVAIFNVGAVAAFAYEKHEIAPEIMLSLTNGSRRENGVNELKLNEELVLAAETKASDMFKFQYFDHESPGGKLRGNSSGRPDMNIRSPEKIWRWISLLRKEFTGL